MFKPKFNSQKFRELMLYVADKSRDDPWFGAVKLSKILYYCDFTSYARHYRPITGATYTKMTEGPVPRELFDERQALVDESLATLKFQRVFTYVQQRLTPTASNVELSDEFSQEDVEIIKNTLDFLRPMTGKEASDRSHNEIGWILANDREVIPYETSWLVPKDDIDAVALTEAAQQVGSGQH